MITLTKNALAILVSILAGCATSPRLQEPPPLPRITEPRLRSAAASSSVQEAPPRPLTLSWDENAPGQGVIGYRVHLGGSWLEVVKPPLPLLEPMSVKSNGVYRITVQAFNQAFYSDHSAPVYLFWYFHPQE